MVLEAITVGIIGLTYVTGDDERKEKMKKIGSEMVEVAGDTVKDVLNLGKSLAEEFKEKQGKKENI